MKLLGCVCILTACTGGGLLLGRFFGLRLAALQEGIRSIELLQAQIRFREESLADSLRYAAGCVGGSYGTLFLEVARKMDLREGLLLQQIWEGEVRRLFLMPWLTPQDLAQLIAIGEQLGRTDRKMQETILQRYLLYANREQEQLAGRLREKTRLYRNLGAILGLFIIVLLL